MEKTTVRRGIIKGFVGSWQSDLATLVISGEHVYCNNNSTVRVLEACYGNFITENHTVDNRAIRGKDIVYSCDESGLILERLMPTEKWIAMHGPDNTPAIGQELEINLPTGGEEPN